MPACKSFNTAKPGFQNKHGKAAKLNAQSFNIARPWFKANLQSQNLQVCQHCKTFQQVCQTWQAYSASKFIKHQGQPLTFFFVLAHSTLDASRQSSKSGRSPPACASGWLNWAQCRNRCPTKLAHSALGLAKSSPMSTPSTSAARNASSGETGLPAAASASEGS